MSRRSILFAMRRLPVVLVLLAACQVEELSETEQAIVNGVQFTPLSGGTVGNVQVGQSSAPFSVTAYPVGNYEVSYTITSITGCSDFSISAPGLPAEIHRTCLYYEPDCGGLPCVAPPVCSEWEITNYTFSTTFHPNVAGASSCAINLQITGLGTKTYTINGTGTVPPIDIDVAPTTVAFGDVRRNTPSSPSTVNIRNLGGSTLTVSSTTISTGFAITSGPTGGFSVPPGGNQAMSVTCNPTAVGPLNGTFRVNSNDPMTPVSTVTLSCNGIDSSLDVTPSPAAVPTTRVGEPTTRQVVLKNTGAAAMTIEGATLSGAGLTATGLPTSGTQIPANGQITSTINFAATAAGDATGMLTITYDGGQMRAVPVSAKALATSMSLTPAGAVDLGPVCVGQSNAQLLTIKANAEGSFRVTQISGAAAPFTVMAPTLPANVQGLGANQIQLTVDTAPTDIGPATATVLVTTDIPGDMPRAIDLSVTGLTAGVSATPPELDLGPSPVNSTTIGQEVEITNCSTSPATLANPRLEGEDAADFAIVQQPPLQVDANGSAKWLIVAQPHSVGAKRATFSVDHSGGTASVMLTADGLGDPIDETPGDGDVKPSYYSCSTGSASGGLPLGLAFGALLLRRRRR